jgi:pyruvate kinase
MNKKERKILKLIEQIDEIILRLIDAEKKYGEDIQKVHSRYKKSAINLIHYRALRELDMAPIQKKLRNLGVTRLAKTNAHVMASLINARKVLVKIVSSKNKIPKQAVMTIAKSEQLVKTNTKNLLGFKSKYRTSRIMVTFPTEAAKDHNMVKEMIKAGMNTARINCAHDGPETWKAMSDHVRKASLELNNHTSVAMDLAGPKIRTGMLKPGPKVLKYRPAKDIYGKVIQGLNVWLSKDPHEDPLIPHVPVFLNDLNSLIEGQTLYLKDTRGKKRKIYLDKKYDNGIMGVIPKTTYLRTGLPVYYNQEWTDLAFLIGELPHIEIPIKLKVGDLLRLDRDMIPGKSAVYGSDEKLLEMAHIHCLASQVFEQVKVGEPVYFDDGKISGTIIEVHENYLIIEINQTSRQITKLRGGKGINFPKSNLKINGLTEKDIYDLSYAAEYADIISMSFVNRKKDVRMLYEELDKLNPEKNLGVILKIETYKGYNNLIGIILEGMQKYPIGVMIARGDLAIETGWKKIGKVQKEILSICQAAHIPVIWATQVLENLAKKGIPSRAEVTDAVTSQRADGVMLNKGPYIIRTIRFLDSILKDMEPYREKYVSYTPPIDMKEVVEA